MGHHRLRARFWIEAAVGLGTLALALLTALVPDWFEAVFGVDPDAHSGAWEIAIVVLLAVGGLAAALVARAEWRRPFAARRDGGGRAAG